MGAQPTQSGSSDFDISFVDWSDTDAWKLLDSPKRSKAELIAHIKENTWRPDESAPPPVLPPIERPAEVVEMKYAAAQGDVQKATDILRRWEEAPESERCHRYIFTQAYDDAIDNNHLPVAALLARAGFPPERQYFERAMKHKLLPFLQLFLHHGFDINTPDIHSTYNPPLLAYFVRDEELTCWMLDHCADPIAASVQGITPLQFAVRDASFRIIKLFFDRVRPGPRNKGGLLAWAMSRGDADRLEVIEFLLNEGAAEQINEVEKATPSHLFWDVRYLTGCSAPLHTAAEEGRLDVVKLLVARGANVSVPDSKGRLAVDRARKEGHAAVVDFLEGPPPRALL